MLPALIAAIPAIVSAASTLLNKNQGKDEAKKSTAAVNGVQLPTLEELQVELQMAVLTGELEPELAKQYLAEASKLPEYQGDPALRQSQMGVVSDLQKKVDAGGIDAQGKARLNDLLGAVATQQRGARGAVMANARERGIGGSGVELMDLLNAEQTGATQANANAINTAAMAEQERDASLQAIANLTGGIRSQDFGEAQAKSSAQDDMNKFNAQILNQNEQFNTTTANATQAQNLAEKQRISDTNTDIHNTQATDNAAAHQALFEDALAKGKGQASAHLARAGVGADADKSSAQSTGNALTTFKDFLAQYGKTK